MTFGSTSQSLHYFFDKNLFYAPPSHVIYSLQVHVVHTKISHSQISDQYHFKHILGPRHLQSRAL